jgi:hypothetical protein
MLDRVYCPLLVGRIVPSSGRAYDGMGINVVP